MHCMHACMLACVHSGDYIAYIIYNIFIINSDMIYLLVKQPHKVYIYNYYSIHKNIPIDLWYPVL